MVFRKCEDNSSVLIYEQQNQQFIIETSFKNSQSNIPFIVKDIKETRDNNYCVEWFHDDLGSIIQEFVGNVSIDDGDNNNVYMGDWHLKFTPSNSVEGMVDQSFGFIPKEDPYFMIPGHIYNTNNIKNSKSVQPQLNYRGDIQYPKSPVLYTRADRSTHNTVLSMYDRHIIGVRIDETTFKTNSKNTEGNDEFDYLYNGLGIDTSHRDPYDRIAMTMGYHHFPVHYYGKLGPDSYSDSNEWHLIQFVQGEAYEVKGHYYFGKISDNFGYEDCLKHFYYQIHQHPGNKIDRVEAAKEIMKALSEDAYNKEYHCFPNVIKENPSNTVASGDTGWTGGMQVAYPMIRAAGYLNWDIDVPLDYIRHLTDEGFNEKANMFYESKVKDQWRISGWWKHKIKAYDQCFNLLEEVHSAYVNGQAVTYLLKSYSYLNDLVDKGIATGINKDELERWMFICSKVIDHVIDKQRHDGAFGVYYNPNDGEPVYYNSFQGAWFLAAVAELYKITGDKAYKEAFYNGNEFYWMFLTELEVWGMPMDAEDAVDEEGNLAYITALKTMHEMTKDKELMQQLLHCLHYEFSWKFAYNTVHVNEPLKSLNWPSCGGSITSSHNVHIHQMGNLICEEIYYVYENTKDPYILDRLKDTLNWGLGTHNSEQYDFGFGKRGWATEQFFHSDGIQDDVKRLVDGGIWYDFLSWAAACSLLSSSLDLPEALYL